MLEAEISPAGTVSVEGHHVGELQGFRFTADQSAGGEDAKAVRTAAQKALATEFETRADKFSICANGDLALASDGTLRWIGAPIGTLVEGEDALKPRVLLLADEQLTGPARDKVAARAERYVNYQIETLLKPLADLKNADQLSGIGKGIAFRLVENFGLINRRDIAEDVKSLDQDGRAALRRLGVRFGAYHVFVPALLKPGPASLITLLWALKNDGKDKLGFGDIVHALASGRTSVVVNQSFDKAFYKLAGFRILGRRAVRVDILERLADLIRPALGWKPGTGGRPEGAYDAGAFVVTPPMMSILGANADDMEDILKGLGYRAEPKSAEEVKARLEAFDAAAREALARMQADRLAAAEAAKAAADAEGAGATSALEDQAAAESTDAPVDEASLAEVEVEAVSDDEAGLSAADVAMTETDPTSSTPDDTGSSSDQEAEAAATVADAASDVSTPDAVETEEATAASEPEPAAEKPAGEADEAAAAPKPVLIWRQARFDRQPRHRDQRHARGARSAGAPGQQTRPAREGEHGQAGDHKRQGEARRDAGGKERFNRKFKGGKPDGDGRRPDNRREGPAGGRPDQHANGFKGKPPQKPREEKPVRFDPDSPFAKLAALRDQLKK